MKYGCPGGNKVKILQDLLVTHFEQPPPPQKKGGGGGRGAYDVSEIWESFRWTYSARLVTIYDISIHSLNIALYEHVSGMELRSGGGLSELWAVQEDPIFCCLLWIIRSPDTCITVQFRFCTDQKKELKGTGEWNTSLPLLSQFRYKYLTTPQLWLSLMRNLLNDNLNIF